MSDKKLSITSLPADSIQAGLAKSVETEFTNVIDDSIGERNEVIGNFLQTEDIKQLKLKLV